MELAEVVVAWRAVAGSGGRLRKVEILADLLRQAGPSELVIVVPWLSGELRQRRTGVGWASLRDVPSPAAIASLTVDEVDRTIESVAALAGPGSTGERRRLVHDLFARANPDEQAFLRGLVSGELRQGALDGVMADAIARAAGVPLADVRRAVMLCGAAAPVAVSALRDGRAGLAGFRLEVGRPIQPMLAATATSVEGALTQLSKAGGGNASAAGRGSGGETSAAGRGSGGETSAAGRDSGGNASAAAFEWKLDGIRVQAHRRGSDVAVFSRSLDDITARVPEVVDAVAALRVDSVVIDGEAIALRPDGRPRPFQETGARVARRAPADPVPLSLFVFDALHVDGADLLDAPYEARHHALVGATPTSVRVPRLVTSSPEDAASFFAEAIAHGHEGVVAKSLSSAYDAGRRGAAWLKVKPVHTLDLVVLAAEWGHGRRRGWLSNLHLGAREPASGGFVMLGKTFKGLTDELLRWQTERLLALESSRNDWQVVVEPELVVEIAFDGVQTSSRYPGGVALRFARVVRYRDDKSPADADTVDTVRAFLG